jgi:hypothetical protein
MTASVELTERVVDAIGRLALLGETIAEEWTYVHDLETVWIARLRAVAAARERRTADAASVAGDATRVPDAELEAALDRLVAEADLVSDPHRAIDWLSTLPQATLVALGEASW